MLQKYNHDKQFKIFKFHDKQYSNFMINKTDHNTKIKNNINNFHFQN